MSNFKQQVELVTADIASSLISKNSLNKILNNLETTNMIKDTLQDLIENLILLKIAMSTTLQDELSNKPVEPTPCLLGKKFRLSLENLKELKLLDIRILTHLLKIEPFELEFSQTDDDGNVTVKDTDMTIPFTILKEM